MDRAGRELLHSPFAIRQGMVHLRPSARNLVPSQARDRGSRKQTEQELEEARSGRGRKQSLDEE